MNPEVYITERQKLWALRHGVVLQNGYVANVNDNLFEPLLPDVQLEFEQGDGHELAGNMLAVYSSSALAVNVFHYWRRLGQFLPVVQACGLSGAGVQQLRFEAQCPVVDNPDSDLFRRPPNVDVLLGYEPGPARRAVAVECKFREPYGGHEGLRRVYLDHPNLQDAWQELRNLKALAVKLSPDDEVYERLHAAQLIKHILGLRHAYGLKGFALLYLWYGVPHQASSWHENELEDFKAVARSDGVDIRSIRYADVILALARRHRNDHPLYVDYLIERYL